MNIQATDTWSRCASLQYRSTHSCTPWQHLQWWYAMCLDCGEAKSQIHLNTTHTHSLPNTHTAVLRPFVWDYPGGPEPEDIRQDFKTCGEDNRGRCTDNLARCQAIWTIDAPTAIIPPVLRGMPFLPQPSQFILAWDRYQTCWIAYLEAWFIPKQNAYNCNHTVYMKLICWHIDTSARWKNYIVKKYET